MHVWGVENVCGKGVVLVWEGGCTLWGLGGEHVYVGWREARHVWGLGGERVYVGVGGVDTWGGNGGDLQVHLRIFG